MNLHRLERTLKADEWESLKPYRCTAGKLTIGVGRNIEDNGISAEESLYLLRTDIARCIRELKSFPWFLDLDGVRQEVLINMCFNLGFPRLIQFRRMLAAIQKGDFEAAADEMLNSKWAQQVGNRAQRLAEEMRHGGK